MTKHYYALQRYYRSARCDSDILARFDSKEERDKWVEAHNSDRQWCHGEWEAVTTRKVSRRFDLSKFEDTSYYYCDIMPLEYEPNHFKRKQAPYIFQRPNYIL